ncbi:DUF1573 domain-containing protein [Flavobacterium limnophilum]|uniref:DUF1573 domain-containing protein n=1 Tax=Flavobacterium limnophilum TaxID=3003262 RepID=UPI0024824825|nr:DUF1573 domain-containing protein [Flavobacterium limnophilum]
MNKLLTKVNTLIQWQNLLYIFIFLLLVFTCFFKIRTDENIDDCEMANMIFKQKEHNFGMIPEGKSVTVLFKFSNTGESPLLIKEVNTSCGCTVPEWPKDIIEPNENGEIKIVYDAKYPGRFNKTITVFYNGKNSPQVLTIKGEVPYLIKEEKKIYPNKIN